MRQPRPFAKSPAPYPIERIVREFGLVHSKFARMRKAKLAHNGVRRGLDSPPRRIDHFGVKKHRSAATRLHAVRSRRHAHRDASINKALIQIKAFGARANEHVACIFRLKHR